MPTDRSHRDGRRARRARAAAARIFSLAADVEQWPAHLPHYRFVRFHERRQRRRRNRRDVGEPAVRRHRLAHVVDVAHDRDAHRRARLAATIRFRHVRGITTGMDVEWTFDPGMQAGTLVRIVHVWNGPAVAGDWWHRGPRSHWAGLRARHRVAHSCRTRARGRTLAPTPRPASFFERGIGWLIVDE